LIIFFAFVGSMIFLTSYASTNGNPGLMFASVDGDKHFCGYDAEHKRLAEDHVDFDKKKLFISDLTFNSGSGLSGINAIFKTSVCVKTCPVDDTKITLYRSTSTLIAPKVIKGYKSYELINLCAPSMKELSDEYSTGWKLVKA
jgi:hypothetical protein